LSEITDAIQKCLFLLSIGSDAYKGLLQAAFHANNGAKPQAAPQRGKQNKPNNSLKQKTTNNGNLPQIAGIKYQQRNGIVVATGISRFFRQTGMADELGSGMRKMMRYCKVFGGKDPEMIEGDVFRIVVKVPEFKSSSNQEKDHDTIQAGTRLALSRHQVQILAKCAKTCGISDLMKVVGRSDRTKFRNQVLRPLLDAGFVEMTIPDKPTSSNQKYRITETGTTVLGNEE